MARAYLYLLRDHLRRSHGAGLGIHLTLLLTLLLWTNIIMASTNSTEGVCGSIDVRNYPSNLMKLENCTVIEGSLHILLIDNGTAAEYENMSFPKLREITDHLLVYRAAGITNLGKLFPNLAVIRGHELFDNYALVIRQVTHLRQVGLTNLRVIDRGSVRIEQNPHLCYVNNIDWSVIAPAGHEDFYFKNNKATDCANCHSQCPTSGGKGLCWNRNACQKICSSGCAHGACGLNDTQFCCDSNCLGGCTGEGPQACFSCKRVYFEGRCREKCPHTHYMINQRRCITRTECLDLGKTPRAIRKNLRYIPFEGDGEKVCRTDCPKGYMRREGNPHMCVPCEGPCPKVCNGTFIITSMSTAQPCSGCTTIEGSLTINIDKGGANIAKELEDSLKDLEEVRDYVKITRSRSLITLHFLRKLRTIHGEKLDRKQYSLIVIGNPNLQELLPLENSTNKLTIKKGKVSVHQNPKLCFYKIKEMVQRTDIVELRNQTKWDDLDMSPLSNGDRVACSQTKLNVTVDGLYSNMVIIQWENFQNMLSDSRSLLGYLIYYKKTKYNVTKFEGRDACSANDWKIKDHDGNGDQKELYLLTDLVPYSRYALYIEALMIRAEEQGAHSDIIYFTTKMATPSPPVDVTTLSRSDDEVMITWHPPKTPNGLIHSYIVRGVREPDEILPERNYCEDPLSSMVDPSRKLPLDESTSTSPLVDNTSIFANFSNGGRKDEECCSCTKDVEDKDNEQSSEIAFENALQNSVYFKNENPSAGKTKRSIRSVNQSNEIQTVELGRIKNDTNKELNTSDRFERVVTDQAMVIVQNLTHFSNYLIEVVACLEHAPENASKCSNRSIASVRTLPKSVADTIDWSTISFQVENGTNVLYVRWDEPLSPNGGIVVYGLEYGTSDKPLFTHCIKRSEYLKYKGYKLSSLQPGNYSFRLRAQSLAGWGEWSRSVYHEVPSNENNWRTVIIAMIFTFLTCIAIIFGSLWVFVKRKLRGQIPHGIEYVSVNPEYISAGYSYEPDEWEVSRDKIKLIKELGQGSFGMVFEGEFEQEPDKFMRCAVKTVNDNASHRDRHNFLQEATVMKAFKCHHVVRLIGVVSVGHPVYVLMEIMSNGDLRSYLRSHRLDNEEAVDPQPPSLAQLLRMAAEIADGMAYLAAKKFVHRDLAARNCMVADELTVKIGDFGMTRDIYETDYYRKGGKGLLPVRWMAPESLKDGVFTSQSDVWSYGVVLWEMATLASQPYQGLSNEQVLKYVINGGTMEQPENCPEKLYQLMSLCWARNPKARPTFTEIIEMLLPDINGSKFREISYYFTIRPQMHKKSSLQEEIDPSTPLKSDLKQSEEESSFSDSEDGVDASFHFFPSRMLPVSENVEEETLQIEETEKTENSVLSESNGVNKVNPKMLNENSKSTSDGSKGSKVSTTTSNGSLANGHLPRYNTTMC